ncbi:GNAT family N-acetyltransferase [Pseudofulvibacter geojedonensis]|uniref:GNAT family N-acetyltransferase n=1 Tax=Pseudofulvibacter geojedonensis TaxID=1123758 RepID=A0ABW3I2S7_9FLAO
MNYQPILENDFVRLEPLTIKDVNRLILVAQEENLIQHSPSIINSKESLSKYIEKAISDRVNKTSIPFIIYHKGLNSYLGSTRFGLINNYNKVLHIGWTWISKSIQGTGINQQMKFLMLQYAFEVLEFEKVEFKIDERNIRSRKAVEKIGGTLEGVLRKDTLMKDGFRRSTCCYGILKEEWPHIKSSIFKGFEND